MKIGVKRKAVRVLIVILAISLAISAAALAGTVLYKHYQKQHISPTVVPGNVITPEKTASVPSLKITTLSRQAVPVMQIAPVNTVFAKSAIVDQANGKNVTLQIYRNHAEDSTPFNINNMFPGDRESKSYYLEVSYRGTVTVHFHADIHSGYEKLAEVLKCSVSINGGAHLYDGLMRDMPQSISYALPSSSGTTETFVYNITVYLETSVGNEYMSKELYADFIWWVNEDNSEASTDSTESSRPPESSDSGHPTETVDPDNPGELIPPPTGDNMHFYILLWIVMACLLLSIILLLLRSRKKRDDREDD